MFTRIRPCLNDFCSPFSDGVNESKNDFGLGKTNFEFPVQIPDQHKLNFHLT